MNLIAPIPGQELGPQYAADQNQSFSIIDSHNHSPSSGVQVTPAGLNISTNLNFQNNSPYNIASVIFSMPAPNSNLTTLYTNAQSGGGITDLFYNDGAGNIIALTKAGEVNATIASLPGESYSGGTFTWKQGSGSTIPANFDIGSITIRPNVAMTTNGIVLSPPSGISSQYNVQLPIVPGSVIGIMQIDTSGNMLSTLVPDNSTLIISSQVLQINPSYTATQQAIASPSGAIIMFGGAAAPNGWLLCDGTNYLQSTYPALFSAIGTAYGSADGTHFNVPDFRGIFPRGTDNGAGNDPDASSRTSANIGGNIGDNVGSTQGYIVESHNHNYTRATTNTFEGPNGAGNVYDVGVSDSTGSFGGNETRPINTYVNFIIKT